MKPNILFAWLLLATALAIPAWAHDGHDHGAAPAVTGPALPRFASSSDLFELVGVADGKFISLYLDRFADNAPVPGASFELEVGGSKVAVKEVAPGEYEGALADVLKPGVTAVTATVVVGADTDLFAGDLRVAEEAPAAASSAAGPGRLLWWGAGGVALLAVLGLALRRSGARRARAGGAA